MIKVTIKQAAIKAEVYTPAELARRVGVQEAVAGRWWKWAKQEDPTPTLRSLDKICDALGCEMSDLFVRNGKKRRK